jgi:RHS repeat-associated protein
MTRKLRLAALTGIIAALAPLLAAHSATPWSAETHTLVAGDFNADGRDDILYVAKDINSASGIALSDGYGPNIARQSWASNHLGIPWYGSLYVPTVADFNGDGRADILMQSAQPGNSYLIFTDSTVWISSIAQTIPNTHLGQGWSAAEHRIVAGDFNGDGRFDLFLQGARKDLSNALYFADANGQFTSGPAQSPWGDSYMNLRWTLPSAIVHAGDFDATDPAWELFVQAKPDWIIIDYDVPFPVPKYRTDSFAIVKVRTPAFCGSGIYVCDPALQRWSRNWQGADWSAANSNAIVADFNGDGRADIFLQARAGSGQNRLHLADANGQVTGGDALLDTTVRGWTSAQHRLLAANFDGISGMGLYAQATSSSGTNYIAPNITASSAGTSAHTPGQTLAATVAGRTAGSFEVSASGEGGYTIPIFTPPAARGMHPELALAYGHRHGAGPVGAGWSVEGLSAITRCPKSWEQDGSPRAIKLDQYDRFCLDGNQLRLTGGAYGSAGATYQTELETFARVTSYGAIAYPLGGTGPTHFIVEQKDGLIVEYGNTIDSRIEALGTSIPHSWAVSKIRDRHGNTIHFAWVEDTTNGSYRISEISYTTNWLLGIVLPAYSVLFTYETKPSNEIDSGYLAGSRIKDVTRLDRIEVKHGAQIVRHYELTYEPMLSSASHSRLHSVQECAGAPLECLAPTIFTYQNGTNGLAAEVSSGQTIPTAAHALPIDVNGDGRTDLVYSSSTTSGAGTWQVMFANSSGGYGAPINTGHANTNYRQAIPIDYNADGLEDVLVPNSSGYWAAMLGTTSGLAAPSATTAPVASTEGNAMALDMNGDGLEDLVWGEGIDQPWADSVLTRYREWGGTFSSTITPVLLVTHYQIVGPVFGQQYRHDRAKGFDVNGDGFRDFVVYLRVGSAISAIAALGGVGGSFSVGSATTDALAIDLNGDGYSDIAYPRGTTWAYHLSTGMSFGPELTGPALANQDVANAIVLDWDTDGYQDILVRNTSTGTWHVIRSDGEALAATTIDTGIAISSPQAIFAVDANGDGLDDVSYVTSGGVYAHRAHAGLMPDLLTTATDGFGNAVSFSYVPITQGAYTKYSSASFPEQDYQGALYVVSGANASNGVGGAYSLNFQYYGAVVHRRGRGFEGFAARRVQDSRTGLYAFDYFRQLFPLTGLVYQHDELQSNGTTLIAQTVATFATNTQGSGNETRHFPFTSSSTSKRWEVGGAYNGSQVSESTTTTLVDAYGTPYDVTTVATEKSTGNGVQANAQYTERLYHPTANLLNDTVNWCLGRPGRTETTASHTQYGGTASTRTVTRTWDAVRCRPVQEVSEPGSATLQVTTDFGYDDDAGDAQPDFGNLTRVTVTGRNPDGSAMAARTTTTSWGSAGQFPESITNALGQTSARTFDYARGLPLSETDPNGIALSWQYDLFGRKTRENRPDGTYTTWTYANCAPACVNARNKLLVTETAYSSSAAAITDARTYLDTFDRPLITSTKLLSGAYNRIERDYDDRGNLTRESEPCLWGGACPYAKTVAYDVLGRPTQVSRPVSQSDATPQTITTHHEGLTTRTVDALAKTKRTVSNVTGKLARSVDHAGYYQSFDYDGFGNPVRVQDSLGNTLQSASFNLRGHKIAMSDMDMGAWAYEYDSLGEMLKIRDAKTTAPAWTTVMAYDALGRMTSRQDVAEAVTSTWTWGTDGGAANNVGKLASLTTSDASYSESFTFDSVGRPSAKSITIAGQGTHQLGYGYNSEGTLDTFTYPATTGASPLKLQYEYASGVLVRIRDFNAPATVFWQANAVNARGQVTQEGFANGVITNRSYDAVTGWLGTIQSGIGGGAAIQNLGYLFDKSGNVTQRQDNRQGLTESFYYDDLYRLDYSTLKVGAGAPATNLDLAYDAMGNITSKSDLGAGTWTYDPARKHQVLNAAGYTYAYDANGNVQSRHGNTIGWYSYNLPKRIHHGASWNEFQYGPNRDRYRLDSFDGSATQTTLYIGGVLEKWSKGALTEWRHYLNAGDQPIAIHTRQTGSSSSTFTRYLHLDLQGSIETVTNADGSVYLRESFDAFGKRRNASGWSGALPAGDLTAIENLSRRGYTFHESIDAATLNHMNGRVQDPLTGRFLSADPFIPDVEDTQSWNRYSYVNNNPLSYVDPSGFFLKKLFKKVVRWLKKKIAAVISAIAGVIAFTLCGGAVNPVAGAACAMAATAAVGYAVDRAAFFEVGFGDTPPARAPPGRRDWASGVTRGGSGVPVFGGGTSGCFTAYCDPGARATVDDLRRRGVILDACDSRGCWVTNEERELAMSGRYREYYALACRNGDQYACRAGAVAADDGEGWFESVLVTATNARVRGSLLANIGALRYVVFSGQVMQQIRIDLARAYVRYLDTITLRGASPVFPRRSDIRDFHNDVFRSHGVGDVFGGELADRIPGFRRVYDWCPVCSR